MPVLKVYKDGIWEELGGTSPMDGGNADTLGGMPASYFLDAVDAHVNDKTNPHEVTTEQIGALPIAGGTMEGTLNLNGIVLTAGVDYGVGDPSGGVLGQLYFKKVT